MKKVTAYKCKHCGTLRERKADMAEHEANCSAGKKGCYTCAHFIQGSGECRAGLETISMHDICPGDKWGKKV